MLNEPNFKPSKRLLNLWICLPQNSIKIQGVKVPPLFGDPRSFIWNYVFVIGLILLEFYTIFMLSEHGVSYNVMLILTIIDFGVALIPLLLEQLFEDFCSPYINAHLFLNKIKLKHTQPNTNESRNLLQSVKTLKGKARIISFISFCVFITIVGFGLWKFFIYYQIYRSQIWVNIAGRLVLLTIALGVFTHLTSTKRVVLDLIVRFKRNREIKAKLEGNGEFVYDNSYEIRPIQTDSLHKKPIFNKISNHQNLLKKIEQNDYNSLSDEDKKKCVIIKTGNHENYFSNEDNFSDAFICYTQLLKDRELNAIINRHKDAFEMEIIAAYGKEIQLSQM